MTDPARTPAVIVRRARLHPDRVDDYERLHREIPPADRARMNADGFAVLDIYRIGLTLLMVLVEGNVRKTDRSLEVREAEARRDAATQACFAAGWEDVAPLFTLAGVSP